MANNWIYCDLLILALDTATPVGSVALLNEEKILAGRYFDVGLQHSQRLVVEIEEIFKTASCAFHDVEAVAVSIGPGSFTGLRIGLSTAKGFCLAGDIALVAVPTLEALAARLPFARHPVCAVLDARKQEVYTALYDTSSGHPQVLSPSRAMALETLLQERAGEKTIFVGNGVSAYKDLMAAYPRALQTPFHCARPEAGAIGWLALARLRAGQIADLETVEPAYLRRPDARIGPRLLADR